LKDLQRYDLEDTAEAEDDGDEEDDRYDEEQRKFRIDFGLIGTTVQSCPARTIAEK